MVIKMKKNKQNSRVIMLLLLAGILLGAGIEAAAVFKGAPVLAQSGETEDGGTDDVAEGTDVPITGPALERASAIALDYVGEGWVTGTEVGDEDGYYEVEITTANGRQIDVHLDEAFHVLGYEDD